MSGLFKAAEPMARLAPTPKRLGLPALLVAALLVLAAAMLRYVPFAEVGAAATLLNLAALAGVVGMVSWALTGNAFGFALGTLDRYSLARAQVALWTVVVFAALLTVAEWNLAVARSLDALNVRIPGPVMAALGLSLFTAAAAPAILAVRGAASDLATSPQLTAATERAASMTGTNAGVVAHGQVGANSQASDASWKDLLTGDDVSVTGRLDLSKVQQALLTLIIVGIYLATVLQSFSATGPMTALPDLGGDAVRLLAISHAGYLAYKAVPKPSAIPDDTK